jgi:hypothetical protein
VQVEVGERELGGNMRVFDKHSHNFLVIKSIFLSSKWLYVLDSYINEVPLIFYISKYQIFFFVNFHAF